MAAIKLEVRGILFCREQSPLWSSLVAYRLGFWAFSVIAQVQSLVMELRFHKPSSAEKIITLNNHSGERKSSPELQEAIYFSLPASPNA